jgi:hypothetical protein
MKFQLLAMCKYSQKWTLEGYLQTKVCHVYIKPQLLKLEEKTAKLLL